MTNRITFNVENMDTIRALDNYCKSQNISRSKAISALLQSTVPALNDITFYHQLGNELNRRLLSEIYRKDLPRREKTIQIDAVKYCQSVFENDLLVYKYYLLESNVDVKRDPSGCVIFDKVNDNEVGIYEQAHLDNICKVGIRIIKQCARKDQTHDYYSCYISLKRKFKFSVEKPNDNIPKYKRVINDGFFLYLKDVVCDGFFFDIEKTTIIKTINIFSVGINGVADTSKDSLVYCWIPIEYCGDCVVIVPVYRLDQLTKPILKNPNKMTLVLNNIEFTFPDYRNITPPKI